MIFLCSSSKGKITFVPFFFFFRDHLVKYLESHPKEKLLTISDDDSPKKSERKTPESTPQPMSQNNDLAFARTNSTLAKIAQAERQSSSESEDSDSSKGAKTSTDRSRPLVRAPSPRRSASPMRRVQIGRSGSRRPPAVAIRSLNYFPPREKIPLKDANADGSSSCDAEQEKISNRTEASARRMSVQDAINLFERKQKEESLTSQLCRSSSEASFIAAKPVLRRWSSGMCEANKQDPAVTNSVNISLTAEEDKNVPEVSKTEIAQCLSPSIKETREKINVTSEWTKKTEAELNQMLVKLMETKVSKYGNTPPPSSQKKDFTKQQKEKTETSRKQTESGAVKPRITPEMNSQKKMKTVSRADPLTQTQKPRRNSSPPVLTKKDVPKSTPTKKQSPKSTLPLIRSSLPSNTYTRAGGTLGKPQGTLSPATPTLKTERTPRPLKSGTISSNETKKVPPKSHEDKKPSSKPRVLTNSRKEADVISAKSTVPAKPRLQNRATKKSTVVPLESKPSKKGTTLEPTVQAKISPVEEKETYVEERGTVYQPPYDHDDDLGVSKSDDGMIPNNVESVEVDLVDVIKMAEVNAEENKEEKVEGISSAAWVEVDQERIHSDSSSMCQVAASDSASVTASSSCARNSLSQMLQAENGEPEMLEWGNAENPPALVYQKDAPTGLKRLLKFARKSKGEVNLADRSSPSVFSDVEEDSEEVKVNGKKSSVKPKNTLPEKTSADILDAREILSGDEAPDSTRVDFLIPRLINNNYFSFPAQSGRSSASSRKPREGQSNKGKMPLFLDRLISFFFSSYLH